MKSSSGCPAFAAASLSLSRIGPDLAGRARDRREGVAGAAAVRREGLTRAARSPGRRRRRRRGGCGELVYHARVGGLRHHDRLAAHQRVAEAAELGADHRDRCRARSGVITSLLIWPGTASCFWPNCGTQKEWMHVLRGDLELDAAVDRQAEDRVGLAVRVRRTARRTAAPYTLTISGFVPAWLFCASTIALTTAIAVTSTAGMTVQMISIVVLPWIGGPSDSRRAWPGS